MGAEIYKEVIRRVEQFIEQEEYEGQNFNLLRSYNKDEPIYQKRLKQIQEDFPKPNK